MCYIVVVDDEAEARNLFTLSEEYFFQKHRPDWHFTVLESGSQALTYISEHPYVDIVLTDLMMSPMDGFTLIQELKEQWQDTKLIIALSAFQDMPNIRHAMNQGAFDFLTKPYQLEDIMATIDKALAHIAKRKEVARLLDQALRIIAYTDQHISHIKKKTDTIN